MANGRIEYKLYLTVINKDKNLMNFCKDTSFESHNIIMPYACGLRFLPNGMRCAKCNESKPYCV